MKKITPFLSFLCLSLLAWLSSCDKPADKQPATGENTPELVINRYAYVLPAASGQFLFSNPAACTLQVMLNGQATKNFVLADLPLQVTVKKGTPDSLIFNTKATGQGTIGVSFGFVQPTGFQSFLIANNNETNRQEGGIGTVDLRDVLKYVVNVDECAMFLDWDSDSLHVTTERKECICVKGTSEDISASGMSQDIPPCNF
jgi:hypothetical protein